MPYINSERPSAIVEVRKKLLKKFPIEEVEGLNLNRVESFMTDLGLEIKPYIIIDREDLRRVKRTMKPYDFLGGILYKRKNNIGIYNTPLGISIILRDPEDEELNGSIFTEGMIVHELGHSSSQHQDLVQTKPNSFQTSRVGFYFPGKRGSSGFIEEGFADMIRARYVAKNATRSEVQHLVAAVAARGFRQVRIEDTIPLGLEGGPLFPIPLKYFYVGKDALSSTTGSSFAGYAIELLCKKIPTLEKSMVLGRTSVEGLREIARLINGVSPGLYQRLQKGNYSYSDYYPKLGLVINEAMGGIEHTIIGKNYLLDWWEKQINKPL